MQNQKMDTYMNQREKKYAINAGPINTGRLNIQELSKIDVSGYNSKPKEAATAPSNPTNLNGNTKVAAPFMFNLNKKPVPAPPKFDAEEELEIDFGTSTKGSSLLNEMMPPPSLAQAKNKKTSALTFF